MRAVLLLGFVAGVVWTGLRLAPDHARPEAGQRIPHPPPLTTNTPAPGAGSARGEGDSLPATVPAPPPNPADAWHALLLRDPGEAITHVVTYCDGSAEREAELGPLLIHELVTGGHAELAASFAAAASDVNRENLLRLAYRAWAERDPEVALDSALGLDDTRGRQISFRAAVSGWALVAPERLADCALELPEGPERNFAIVSALRSWRARESGPAYAWISRHQDVIVALPRPELVFED